MFVGHRPRRYGATGIDFENGYARRFANRFAEFELGSDRRKIENDRRKSAARDMLANPFRRIVAEEREERDSKFIQS